MLYQRPLKPNALSYGLKWYCRGDRLCSWFIRGIKPDRSFYGEVTIFSIGGGGRQVNAVGSLSESDYAKLLVLIEEIEKHLIANDPDCAVGRAACRRSG